MGHMLDVVTATGEKAIVFAKEGGTPWHRYGHPMEGDELSDLDRAGARAGIFFPVEKMRHAILVPVEDGDPRGILVPGHGLVRIVESKDSWSLVRTDRMQVIGTVGDVYTPHQMADAVAPLRPVVADGLATIETAGSLRGGSQCWMMLKFDTDAIIERARSMVTADATSTPVTAQEIAALEDTLRGEAGDGILPYGLVTVDHSGRRKNRLKETGVRVVCANTLEFSLGMSEGGISIEVPHVSTIKKNWDKAAQSIFGDVVKRFIGLANYRSIMKRVTVDEQSFIDLVLEATIPVTQLEEKIRRRDGNAHTEAALRRSSEKRLRIRDLWENGAGQTGDHSAWEAYQGAVEFIDHDAQALPANGDRVQSLVDGSLGRAKTKVFRNMMQYSVNRQEGEDVVADLLGRGTAPVVEQLLASGSAAAASAN